tara:strand:+ start:1384 stop:1572 length:189 start_codon:yes stop_codon:yes gene_type:complete
MLSKGTRICIHIDYEEMLLTNNSKPSIIRELAKTWSLSTSDIEEVIKEEEAFLDAEYTGEFV